MRVSSWGEYERLLHALTADASFKTTPAEHRLVHADGRCLDLVPFGGVEGAGRTVTYPAGGTTHSVLGLSECEACCVEADLGEGVVVRAVEPPGLILLKARTYLDRRPAIIHDIRDLDFVVRTYRDVLGDSAVFERAGDLLRDEEVVYQDVGAFVLARDILGLGIADEVVVPLRELVAELNLPQSTAVDDVLLRREGPQAQEREAVAQRYSAFQKGLKSD